MSDDSILILLKLALIFLVKFTDPIISQICIAVTLHFTLLSANKWSIDGLSWQSQFLIVKTGELKFRALALGTWEVTWRLTVIFSEIKNKKNFKSKLWPKKIECQGLVEIDWHPDSLEILKYRKSSIKSLAGAYLFQVHLSRSLIETRGLFVSIFRNDDGISFPWRTRIQGGKARKS